MTRSYRARTGLGLIAMLLVSGAAQAASPAAKCQAAKLKTAGKLSACRLLAQAKGVKKGVPDVSADVGRCEATFMKSWTRAETKGGTSCPTFGDAASVLLLVDVNATATEVTLGEDRFLDNGNGTIIDTRSGLMWEKKTGADDVANYGDPHDVDNTYKWSNTDVLPDGGAFTTFLGSLNQCSTSLLDPATINGGFAGHCDWRLPTAAELRSLFDYTSCHADAPCIDPIFTPTAFDFNFPMGKPYWSSTAITATSAYSQAFSTFAGQIITLQEDKAAMNHVRAVRGGPPIFAQ